MIQEKEDVRLERPIKDIWSQVLDILAKTVSQPSFEGWLRPTQLIDLSGNEATIGVCNEMAKSMIAGNHLESLAAALYQVLKRKVSVKIVVDPCLKQESYTPSLATLTVPPPPVVAAYPGSQAAAAASGQNRREQMFAQLDPQVRLSSANLNAKYTFESFVVGSHSRFLHSAAAAVADRPGQAYNPLFLYGGVGLGKTHLMQAIGYHVLFNQAHLQIRYISCERFTNELINSIKDDRMIEFRKRYRQVDLLLMDDVQFIEGKERTQEEFFYTFNALIESGRQIVLSSDRPPQALTHLEERLRSRFAGGLIADIQPPDLETRVAILRKKSEQEDMNIPDDVLEYIASVYTNNVRELAGALTRTLAYARLAGGQLTVSTIAEVLQPGVKRQSRAALTLDKIIETVSAHYRLESSELRSAKRSADLTLPRHLAMYLAHELIQLSFPRIGDAFSNRKHTSALYAHSRIKEQIVKDRDLALAVKQISHQLTN